MVIDLKTGEVTTYQRTVQVIRYNAESTVTCVDAGDEELAG